MIIPRDIRMSHSEADAFAVCPRRHFYGYGMRLSRIKVSDALDLGTKGHDLLQKYFTAVVAMGGWDKVDIMDIVTPEITLMMQNGTDPATVNKLVRIMVAFKNKNPFKDYDILVVEGSFESKITDDFWFAPFIIDLVIRHKITRKIYVVDHKFNKDFYKPWDLKLLPQIPLYIGGLRNNGIKVEGGFYHVLRKGFGVKATDDDIIQLVPIDPTDSRIKNTFIEHIKMNKTIRRLRSLSIEEWERDPAVIRINNNMVCGHCQFNSICVGDLNGHSTRFLVGSEYRVKEDERDYVIEDD